jgi:hypothetical protein
MKAYKYLLSGFLVGSALTIYNYFVFVVFDFYPDFILSSITDKSHILALVFIKGFFVGIILSWLFSVAYNHIYRDDGKNQNLLLGILFFAIYGIFAMVSFTLGDWYFMGTDEGMFVYLTFDGVIETFIATVPIRFFYSK